MKIIETGIPDVTKQNVDEAKIVLSDNIIKNVFPLFDDVYQAKLVQLKTLKESLNEKKTKINENKTHLEELMSQYNKEKKKSKLLTRIEKLIQAGLIYDGTIKNQTIVLLRVIDKLTEDKIDHHLKETLQIIKKRFKK